LQRLMASAHHSGEDRDDMTLLLLEAAPGTSQFNNVAGTSSSFGIPIKATCAWYGERDDEAVLQIRGRGTWQDCDAFYDTAHALADDLKPVVIDLSTCDYLDSTFLGTVHELVTGSKVRLQSLTPAVRATFEEMDMRDVLRAADQPMTPLPDEMAPLSSIATPGSASQKRILKAHETLSALSEKNRGKFAGVVEAMRTGTA
jgi:anti-anti-sigma regulatory factor